MRRIFATWALASLVFFFDTSSPASAADVAPAVSDESRLIRLETKVDALVDLLEQRMDRLGHCMDRIEHLEESLRTDMNSQFDRLNALSSASVPSSGCSWWPCSDSSSGIAVRC